MDAELAALAGDYWAARCATFPFEASILGYHEFDEVVPDLSAQGQAAQAAALGALARRAEALDRLDDADGLTAALLSWEARAKADELEEAAVEHTASPAMAGPLVAVFETCPRLALPDAAAAVALVVRYRRLAAYFDLAGQRLVDGARSGRPPAAHTTSAAIGWLDRYLASDLAADPLLAPRAPAGWAATRTAAWREALSYAVASSVRPALQRYRDTLANRVLPHARPPEAAGLCAIRDGGDVYASAVRRHATRVIDPDELHRIGHDEIDGLAEEYRALGARALGTTDLAEIYRRLRDDPALRFSTSGEVVEAASDAVQRAQEAVPDWFGRLPSAPCAVRPMEAHTVEHGTIARYLPPASDGSRPGVYYVNAAEPETRTRFEAEALAFHEAVPGHHLQIALAQELDVATFRRHLLINAYVEGWALYCERLADEMGLYSNDLTRLGMLGFDSWRAGRLVVDTGLHHLGWSREQAIAYLRDNSPLAENNIANEVDRYIVEPAQALSYKVGQRAFAALRARSRARLDSRFDLAAFHDAALRSGPVPLDLLARVIDDWTAARAGD